MLYWTSRHAISWDSGPGVMHVSYIAPEIMYVTIEPNQYECWVLLHWISGQVCSSYIRPVCMSVLLSLDQLPTGSADIFNITHVWLCGTGTNSYDCNSYTRLAGMLQYPCFKCCFEPTGMFVAVAPEHLARPLQLNSSIYQHICLNQLQLTYKHICSCVAEPAGIYVTSASDPQPCLYARTQLTSW